MTTKPKKKKLAGKGSSVGQAFGSMNGSTISGFQ
jgi:hypothetical protein